MSPTDDNTAHVKDDTIGPIRPTDRSDVRAHHLVHAR
jgi:hypothetical protein